jgi:hypothetical protein
MGNRLEEGLCLRCGFPLMTDKQLFCTQCEGIVAEQVRKIKANPKLKGKKLKLPTHPGQVLRKNVVHER